MASSYFWLDGSNNRYYLGQPFTYSNVQYTGAGATQSTFTTLGFTKITVATRPDGRFYTVTGPANDGSWTSTARPIAELKDTFTEREEGTFHSVISQPCVLASVVLSVKDNSGSIPADYTTFVANSKTYKDANVVKINAVTNAAGMESLVDAQKWVLVDPADPADGYQLNSSTYLEPYPLNPVELSEVYGSITFVRAGANLTSAKFGAAADNYTDVRGVFAYEIKGQAVNTPGTELDYSMPNGFSGTGLFPASGDTTFKLFYQDITGTQIGTTITLTDAATAQTFSFGNQY